MNRPFILASGSEIRARLLHNAGISIRIEPARIDEHAIRVALHAEGANPRDIADALAEGKARKISERHREALVLGCDQIAALNDEVLVKPETQREAMEQLRRLSGKRHKLFSAAVLYENGLPIWRHVGQVRLTVRELSRNYIDDYVTRNWDSIRHSVGAYKLEEEGVRLFSRIEGDYFNVLGLPLTELLRYLIARGELEI
jgi:septum formation protein